MTDPIVEGQTARNPQTGERIIYRRGRWYPLGPDGQQVQPPAAPRAGTAGQAQDSFNTARMEGANRSLDSLEGNGFDMGLVRPLAGENNPLAVLQNDHTRQYTAAQNEWADALLRMTTGAAATQSEINRIDQTYFPQFGDSPEVRELRRRARERVTRDAEARSGRTPIPDARGIQDLVQQQNAMIARSLTPAAPSNGGYRILSVEH